MKKNQYLTTAFVLLISLLMGCTDKTPKPVVLDRNYFVGTWELYSPIAPAGSPKIQATFLENGTVLELRIAGSTVPSLWFFNSAQRQITFSNDSEKYYIVEYSADYFVWQGRSENYEGNYQRFNRK